MNVCETGGHRYALVGAPYTRADTDAWFETVLCASCGETKEITVLPSGAWRVEESP